MSGWHIVLLVLGLILLACALIGCWLVGWQDEDGFHYGVRPDPTDEAGA